MSRLILPSRFTSQPQTQVQIDWSNPLAKDCAGYYLPTNPNTSSGSPGRTVSKYGVGNTFVRASSQSVTIPLSKNIVCTTTGATVVGIANSTDLANVQGIFSVSDGTSYFAVLFRGDLGGTPISAASWDGSSFIQWTTSAYTSGTNYVIAITTDTLGNFNVYVNGVLQSGSKTNTGSLPTAALNKLIIGSADNGTTTYLSGASFFATAFGRVLSVTEIKALSDNPWQIFKAPQGRIWVAGSGTVWNVSISESVSLSEALSAIAGFQGVQSEALTLTESQSATNLAVVSASESIALADMPSSGVATGASISEAMALVESITAALNAAASVAESIALSETSSAAASFSAAIAESVTLADSLAASAQFSAVMAEALALADTSSTSGQVISATISESMALVDTWAATAALSAAIVEAGALTDSVQATAQFGVVQVETLALTESPAAGTVWTVSISELMTLADVVNWAGDLVATPGYRVALAAQKRQVKLTETNWRTTLPVTIRIVKIRKELP